MYCHQYYNIHWQFSRQLSHICSFSLSSFFFVFDLQLKKKFQTKINNVWSIYGKFSSIARGNFTYFMSTLRCVGFCFQINGKLVFIVIAKQKELNIAYATLDINLNFICLICGCDFFFA